MKTLLKYFIFFPVLVVQLASAASTIKVATFDSGFGGYFTAKEIETVARDLESKYDVSFEINHYGDTKNAPYGSRKPEDIAALSAKGIATAFDRGAEHVFIACNTASTQYEGISALLKKSHPLKSGKFISIIDASVAELRRRIDTHFKDHSTATVAILATPATVRSGAYVKALAKSFGVEVPEYEVKNTSQKRWLHPDGPEVISASGELTFRLKDNKSLRLVLVGPSNWVDLIENGAEYTQKKEIIARDLKLLSPKGNWDIVAEFCTHFPAIEKTIKSEGSTLGLVKQETNFLAQGPLMAAVFKDLMLSRLFALRKKAAIPSTRAKIFISGENVDATRTLAKEVFPGEPVPDVNVLNFR